jgi:hypothetical protein
MLGRPESPASGKRNDETNQRPLVTRVDSLLFKFALLAAALWSR